MRKKIYDRRKFGKDVSNVPLTREPVRIHNYDGSQFIQFICMKTCTNLSGIGIGRFNRYACSSLTRFVSLMRKEKQSQGLIFNASVDRKMLYQRKLPVCFVLSILLQIILHVSSRHVMPYVPDVLHPPVPDHGKFNYID